ncbi:hypothetical protein [Clostridium sp.]|uniref:hypothetical protein n=1 Tax=Clostridium sp. TaxID=1506 RepID=UPI0035A0A545
MNIFKKNYYTIITILGLLICIIWLITVNTQPFSDFDYYNKLAQQIAKGGPWGDTYTSVGYSIILGFIYSIFGINLISAKILNIALTFINYMLLYKILYRIPLSKIKRKIIYTMFVFFPNNIFYTGITANEILFTTILLSITLTYYSNTKLKYILIGILTAINAMIKPFFIIFFLVIFIIELITKYNITQVLKHTSIILVVSALCISPWIYRNTKFIGEFTSISNNGGIVLYINNNSQNKYGRWMAAKKVKDSVVLKKEYIEANMTEKNRILTSSAKKWIIAHPLQFIELGLKRLFNTYFIADDIFFAFNGTSLNKYIQIMLIIYTFLTKIIVFGAAIIYIIMYSKKTIVNLLKKEHIDSYTLYNLICFYMFSCVYFITEGQGRYSFPFIFIMIYFFSFWMEKILKNREEKLLNG